MRSPRRVRTGLMLWLLCGALSGCGDATLVTVGIRPTDGAAAPGDTPSRGADDAAVDAPDGPVPTSDSGGPDAGGAASAGDKDACGDIPLQPAGRATSGRVSGSGRVEYAVDVPNVFVGLRTTLAVPAEPPPGGPIFIWTGVQPAPDGANLQPIGNGATLSLLAWGPSCPPDAPASYSTWWTAPMYTNLSSSDPRYSGCHSGGVVLTQPKTLVDIDIHSDGTMWVQKVVNRSSGDASGFSMDLAGQKQGRAFFNLALQTSNKPTEDLIFTNTVLSMALPVSDACEPLTLGMDDFASTPRVSADGKHCCIDRIVLRAPGVAATTVDPP